MKKMLFAAMVACAAGAYAQCGIPDPGPGPSPTTAAYVYDFKASLKTPVAKYTTTTETATCMNTGKSPTFYRVKGTVTLKGVIVDCSCGFTMAADAHVYVTSSTSKYTTGSSSDGGTDTYAFDVVNFIGGWTTKKATTSQVFMTIAYTDWSEVFLNSDLEYSIVGRPFELWAAGFGSKTTANGVPVVNSVSGSIVGKTLVPANYIRNCSNPIEAMCFYPCDPNAFSHIYEGEPMPSNKNEIWSVNYELTDFAGSYPAGYTGDVAFGSWSLKYNKSLSALAVSNGYEAVRNKVFPKVLYWDGIIAD